MICVCGEALFDVFVAGEAPGGFTFDARIGGSAFNVAVALARLGHPVGLLTGISTDFLGDKLVGAMEQENVSTRFLKRTDAPTTLALVSLGEDGGARYRFLGEGAADRQVEHRDLPPLEGVDALVFGCFSLLTQPTGDSFLTLAGAAAGRTVVVLDPNVRPTVEPDMARWRERIDAFAAHAHIVKSSTEDLAALGLSPENAARHWRAAGASIVVVTRGADGALVFAGESVVPIPAPSVAVVDTVGAGDAFLAALVGGLAEAGRLTPEALRTMPADEAARVAAFAASVAAITCTRRGADPPDRASCGAIDPDPSVPSRRQ